MPTTIARKIAAKKKDGSKKVELPDAPKEVTPNADSVEAAKEVGLIYVSHTSAGIHRKKSGKSFAYVDHHDKKVRDAKTLGRIKSLVIPPAWEDVWICASERGHIQAVGNDARGRRQYRYHPRFREVRDQAKFGHMLKFVKVLPKIRARTRRDLARKGMPREKVLAVIVRLLEATLIRVGNEQYAKENNSYGLTTLKNKHADITGGTLHFHFRGKSGVVHDIDLQNKKLAKIVKKCQDLPGQDLFAYQDDDGTPHTIRSDDVNAYLHEIVGDEFTAKDFRTWAGTVLAAQALQEFELVDSEAARKKNVVQAVESVASRLGNTKAVCRKCYIHPQIIDSYMDGSLLEMLKDKAEKMLKPLKNLRPEEAAVLVLLTKRLSKRKSESK